ncbi:cyclopropane-fatty-acyl-phospholipid synthase [Burkholderia gladioli]|nr:cyclopropane-fatty-acyl-phospholipid synthase [Burkholderia gladioli]TWC59687.1 cyclopropane-fatty-acyl-phospholipid synthase [Burkholderia sp. SJZ089]TWC94664.1 cyclopropane-fatty-acyl-phospholipid synthase [Burkholderia sp. SJZ115]TWC96576.1 cyclopropane-fatty-acyl-phospholipid synthase [Burkholderia sp. SJZ091]MBU9170294.1 class I SAM-dependent methyltransferase [Burkholderia gladioli]
MSMETLDAATAAATPTGASAEAIQHHYDVGNAFYALWLDSTMTYSSALWHRDDEDLETAQRNKLDWHLARAGSAGARRLLDVGCGWGGLIRRALQGNPDCHCTGLTLSREQHAFLGGLDPHRVDVRLESWADHQALAPYDGIVSIGAFEHFARLDQSREEKIAGYRDFFRFCSRNLVEGGHVSLQTIVYENSARQHFSQFFEQTIFPESDLPHLAEIAEASQHLFEIVELRNDRHHYARTLRQWSARLRQRREEAIALAGERTYRDYEKYLALMVVAFHTGSMNLSRLALRRLPAAQAFATVR